MKTGRPRKARIVKKEPHTRLFSPRGRIGRPGTLDIKHEELEAIRLIDHVGLDQKEAAKFMGISQQTLSRVLRSGRKSLAEALVKGLIIRVSGGDFRIEK
ncbi:MAG: DUF134 domain-containing protein [Candidatus Omnitrophota bacterium]|jgi:predicted DNA-binding protein (UPF0251 family)